MKTVNTQISRLTSNPIGSLVGAGAGYYVAKKLMGTQKMWITIAITIVGGMLGAGVQSRMGKKGVPTAATVTGATK
jgi:outer membrane lipoprotein SlyB